MAALIPMKPKSGKFDLTDEERTGLNWYVLSGCSREEAFLKFIRPDFINSKTTATVKSVVSQFFAMKATKDYIEAYRQTIVELTEPSAAPKEEKPKQTGTLEERKARALSKLVDFVLAESEHIGERDEDGNGPDAKSIMDFANRIGLFDSKEQIDEQPRRYLPVTCGDCAYRKFVEENCERVEDSGTEIEEK